MKKTYSNVLFATGTFIGFMGSVVVRILELAGLVQSALWLRKGKIAVGGRQASGGGIERISRKAWKAAKLQISTAHIGYASGEISEVWLSDPDNGKSVRFRGLMVEYGEASQVIN